MKLAKIDVTDVLGLANPTLGDPEADIAGDNENRITLC